jgi:hypothetical protein
MITAMQTLISQIETEINKGGNGAMATGFDYGLKKAKQLAEQLLEMEKEQKIKMLITFLCNAQMGEDVEDVEAWFKKYEKQQKTE